MVDTHNRSSDSTRVTNSNWAVNRNLNLVILKVKKWLVISRLFDLISPWLGFWCLGGGSGCLGSDRYKHGFSFFHPRVPRGGSGWKVGFGPSVSSGTPLRTPRKQIVRFSYDVFVSLWLIVNVLSHSFHGLFDFIDREDRVYRGLVRMFVDWVGVDNWLVGSRLIRSRLIRSRLIGSPLRGSRLIGSLVCGLAIVTFHF